MLQPTLEDVRRFFCEAWLRHLAGAETSPLERVAIACILEHPEYQELLAQTDAAVAAQFPVELGRENPFLHLSMHLTLEDQVSVDSPRGIRALLEALQVRYGDRHAAFHQAMECLGEMLWQAQRGSLSSDIRATEAAYLECLQRRLGRRNS